MCDERSSLGLTEDGGTRPLASVISIASHEVGHNFNMRHDDGMHANIISNYNYRKSCFENMIRVCEWYNGKKSVTMLFFVSGKPALILYQTILLGGCKAIVRVLSLKVVCLI